MKYEIDFESLRVSTCIYFTDLSLNELLSFCITFQLYQMILEKRFNTYTA